MSQNFDLIEVVAGTDSQGECNCSESDFTSYFISKLNGTFESSFGSTDTSWSPYSFYLGVASSTNKSTITVEGNAVDKAEIVVKGGADQCFIRPNEIQSPRFRTTNGAVSFENSGSVITSLTFNGDLVPGTNNTRDIGSSSARLSNIWSVNANISGTMTISSISPSTLSVTSTSTFTGLATFNGNISVPGTATLGTIGGTTATIETGNFTTLVTSPTGTFTNATVAKTPSANTDVVRRQDVYVSTNPTLALGLHKIEVAGGFITNVQTANGADLPTHVGKHHTTTRTTNAPAEGQGGDGLNSYEIGAVERANPVVSHPLRITTTADHTYANAAPYFVVLNAGSLPAASGPEGQIIFRKAQA